MSDWPSWDEWRDGLDGETRARAEYLRDLFARLGADDPEMWARSEVNEGIAQLGRFVFLRAAWEQIERWRDRQAVADILPHAPDELLETARSVAGRAAFDVALNIIHLLDDEQDPDAEEPLPGWRLMELDSTGQRTGRDLGALHESFLDADPRHIDGEDMRGW